MDRQLKSLFQGYWEICPGRTCPCGVSRSHGRQAGSSACTDVIPCHMPPACWSVFQNNLMSACQWRKALGKHTHQTGRAGLVGKGEDATRAHRRLLARPSHRHPNATLGTMGINRRTGHCAAPASRPAPRSLHEAPARSGAGGGLQTRGLSPASGRGRADRAGGPPGGSSGGRLRR